MNKLLSFLRCALAWQKWRKDFWGSNSRLAWRIRAQYRGEVTVWAWDSASGDLFAAEVAHLPLITTNKRDELSATRLQLPFHRKTSSIRFAQITRKMVTALLINSGLALSLILLHYRFASRSGIKNCVPVCVLNFSNVCDEILKDYTSLLVSRLFDR